MSLKHELNKQGCTKENAFLNTTTTLCENHKKVRFQSNSYSITKAGERTLSKEYVSITENVLASIQQRAQAHPIWPGPILAQAHMGLSHRAQAQMGPHGPCAAV